MCWHVYCVPPMDQGWDFLLTVAEALALSEESMEMGFMRDDWRAAFNAAQAAAEEAGWEGDFRGEPHILMLPLPEGLKPGFVWKQDNGGACFVVTPCPLPWLTASA